MKTCTQIPQTEASLSVQEALFQIFYQTKTVLIIRYFALGKLSTIRTIWGCLKGGPKLPSLDAQNWLAKKIVIFDSNFCFSQFRTKSLKFYRLKDECLNNLCLCLKMLQNVFYNVYATLNESENKSSSQNHNFLSVPKMVVLDHFFGTPRLF